MSLSLTLLPFRYGETYSYVVLPVDGDYMAGAGIEETLAERLYSELDGCSVPQDFNSYMAEGDYGPTAEDSYGKQIRCVSALSLLLYAELPAVKDVPRNRATWAYLAAAPELLVAMYWH